MYKNSTAKSAGKADTERKNGSSTLRSAAYLELEDAKKTVEEEIGFKISDDTSEKILAYTIRKMEVIRERESVPDDYIALLYGDELRNHFVRRQLSTSR